MNAEVPLGAIRDPYILYYPIVTGKLYNHEEKNSTAT